MSNVIKDTFSSYDSNYAHVESLKLHKLHIFLIRNVTISSKTSGNMLLGMSIELSCVESLCHQGLHTGGMHILSMTTYRRKKPREDLRHRTTWRGRNLVRRTSPTNRGEWLKWPPHRERRRKNTDTDASRPSGSKILSLDLFRLQIIIIVCFVFDKHMHVDCSRE